MAFAVNKKTEEVLEVGSDEELENLLVAFEEDGTINDWEIKDSIEEISNEELDAAINDMRSRDTTGTGLERVKPYSEYPKESVPYKERKESLGAKADIFPNASEAYLGGKGNLRTAAEAVGDVVTLVPRAAYSIGAAAIDKAKGVEPDMSRIGRTTEEGYREGTPLLSMAYDPFAVGTTAASTGIGLMAKAAPATRSALSGIVNSVGNAAGAAYNDEGTAGVVAGGLTGLVPYGAEKGALAIRKRYVESARNTIENIARRMWRGPRGTEVSGSELWKWIGAHEDEIRDAMSIMPSGGEAQRKALSSAADEIFQQLRGTNIGISATGDGVPLYRTSAISEKAAQNLPTKRQLSLEEKRRKLTGLRERNDNVIKSMQESAKANDQAIAESRINESGLRALNQRIGLDKSNITQRQKLNGMRLDPAVTDSEIKEFNDWANLEKVLRTQEQNRNKESMLRSASVRENLSNERKFAQQNIDKAREVSRKLDDEIKSIGKEIGIERKNAPRSNFGRSTLVPDERFLANVNGSKIAEDFQRRYRENLHKAISETVGSPRTTAGTLVSSNPAGTRPGQGFVGNYGNVQRYVKEIVIDPIETEMQHSGRISTDNIINALDKLAYINDDRAVDAFIDSMPWISDSYKQLLKKNTLKRSQYLKLELGRSFNELTDNEQNRVIPALMKAGSVKLDNFARNIKSIIGEGDKTKAYAGNPKKIATTLGDLSKARNYGGDHLERQLLGERALRIGSPLAGQAGLTGFRTNE